MGESLADLAVVLERVAAPGEREAAVAADEDRGR